MTRFCPKCGAPVADLAAFCTSCGTRFAPGPNPGPAAYGAGPGPNPGYGAYRPARKSNTMTILGCCFLGISLLALFMSLLPAGKTTGSYLGVSQSTTLWTLFTDASSFLGFYIIIFSLLYAASLVFVAIKLFTKHTMTLLDVIIPVGFQIFYFLVIGMALSLLLSTIHYYSGVSQGGLTVWAVFYVLAQIAALSVGGVMIYRIYKENRTPAYPSGYRR